MRTPVAVLRGQRAPLIAIRPVRSLDRLMVQAAFPKAIAERRLRDAERDIRCCGVR